jgi:hypothetical protein
MYGLADSRSHETVGGLRETCPFVAHAVGSEHDGLCRGMPLVNERSGDGGLGAAAVEEHRVHFGLMQRCERQDTRAFDDREASSAQEERSNTPERRVVRRDEDYQELFPATRRMNKPRRRPPGRASTGRLVAHVLSVSSGGGR